MKRFLLAILIMALLLSCFNVPAEAKQTNGKTNWQIVKELTKKHGKPIKLVDEIKTPEKKLFKLIETRKGKPYILVTKVVSVSDGTGYGWYTTEEGNRYIIGYNKKVRRWKTVTSYIIWNPKTNYEDDILYVVDNKTWR